MPDRRRPHLGCASTEIGDRSRVSVSRGARLHVQPLRPDPRGGMSLVVRRDCDGSRNTGAVYTRLEKLFIEICTCGRADERKAGARDPSISDGLAGMVATAAT